MKILIDIHHPARVHLFRNLYHQLIQRGHDVKVIYKEKEKVKELLDLYGIPATKIGENKSGKISKTVEFMSQMVKTFLYSLKFRPDIYLSGASPVLAWNRTLMRNKYISFSDTEHAKLTWKLSKPFIDLILTPQNFLHDLGKNHTRINSFKELAYLHPKYFNPNKEVLKELNVADDQPYIVLRFISWGAIHDIGQSGIAQEEKLEMVKKLSEKAKVFISSEAELPDELKPYQLPTAPDKIHDVLYYATLFYGESGTMATEAALLGTPTVRVSSLAKKLGNFQELQEKYKLLHFYDTNEEGLKKCMDILSDPESKIKWKEKAQLTIAQLEDLNEIIINSIEKYDT